MSLEFEDIIDDILDLVALDEKNKVIKILDLLPFGPCDIARDAWRRLRLAVKANTAQPAPKEVPFALLGKLHRDRFVIEEILQVATTRSDSRQCIYDLQDIVKIEKEAAKEGLMLVGVAHTHVDDSPAKPSQADRLAWLSIMFEFNRPLYYYVISASLEAGAYSIPVEVFLHLKESIRFLPVEMREDV